MNKRGDIQGIVMTSVIILGICLLIFAIVYGVIMLEKKSCNQIASSMGVESYYTFYTECMIKINDKWIPLDNYREFEK